MKLAQYLDFYDRQASEAIFMDSVLQRMTGSIQNMTDALDRTVGRMDALLTSIQKTGSASADIEAPFDNVTNNLAKAVAANASATNISDLIKPQNLIIGLAISVGWQLFGDDIMTLLSPAMAALQAFAGLVHGVVGGLAPVLSLVSGAIGGVAMVLGNLGNGISVLQPLLGGAAAALGFLYVKTLLNTMALQKQAGATGMVILMEKARAVATNVSAAAQKVFDLVMNASPTMKIAAIIIGIVTALISWMSATGALKGVWTSFMDGVISAINWIFKLINHFPGVNIEMITTGDTAVEDSKKTQEDIYSAAQPVTMPDTSALTAQLPDYDALSTGNSVYSGGGSGADWSGEPLTVDTVGILESVTGPMTMSDETMGMLGTMMAENRSDVTVTPTVVVNATVREESDIRKLVSGIERVLEEEFRASAEGVYSGTGGRTVSC